MEFQIRNYSKKDLERLYEICLKTGNSGKDASHIYNDHKLLGHYYVAPYVIFHPELTFILALNDLPIGYILGTNNSYNFYLQCEKDYFPAFRKKYTLPSKDDISPDANIIRLIYKGHLPKDELKSYPAHLHIDILPEGQGQGFGKKLINTFTNKLREMDVPAVHLEVGKKNTNAIRFYEKTGFHLIKEYEFSLAYGMYLS
ncbi:GNAT family N-acetyltransferase [Melioribacteraceae bacterium 4301-Me]|uniref:GNAT family N-acetyltransferase n=1 Tax=Pyranulibacter aquaticus TaxID=3163344 RepID=UPI0035975FB4